MSHRTSTHSERRTPQVHHVRDQRAQRAGLTQFFTIYFWFIVKNVIGWIFILGSLPLGVFLPGPGGLPIFLIGFALVTFPGKRKLTSRVMRGRGLPIEAQVFTFITAAVAIIATSVLMWIVSDRYLDLLNWLGIDPRAEHPPLIAVLTALIGIGIIALGVTWVVMRLALKVFNYLLRAAPIIRRKVRPWLRKRGLRLLPSRRKRMEGTAVPVLLDQDEILEIHERHHHRLRAVLATLVPWAKRAIGVGITIAIFVGIFKPIVEQWAGVKDHIFDISILSLVVASIMFAVFLFVFRAMAWRRILQTFGYTLPVPAATRIWSTSELARYLPLAIWQVVGRVILCKPYGVRGTVCSISQILELAIFLLANLLLAIACLLYFGIKNLHGAAEIWLYVACGLVPVLLVLLHPRIFYGMVNPIVSWLGKPPVLPRLDGWQLLGLLGWNILGLLWQTLALYLLLDGPLGLKLDWWWVLAGSYCLAWCAGFLAVWAPGGIGVRELVFITAMQFALPQAVRDSFARPDVLFGFLAFLSVLLRIWTTAGELLLAAIAYSLDLRGALGFPDAPGRIPITQARDMDPAA